MAAALREAFALVTCPICARQVESAFINAHIDSGCQKHGRKPQQQQPPPGSARRRPAEEDEGTSPPPATLPSGATLRGLAYANSSAFLGVRFAQPPVFFA